MTDLAGQLLDQLAERLFFARRLGLNKA